MECLLSLSLMNLHLLSARRYSFESVISGFWSISRLRNLDIEHYSFFFVSAVSDRFFAVKMFVQGIRVRHAWAFCQVISLRVSCMQLSKNGQVHPRLFKGWSARFSSPSSMMVAGSRFFLDFSGWSYWIFVDLRPRCILQFFYEAESVANDVFWNSRPTQDFLRTSGKDKSLRELWGNRSDDIVHDGCWKPCSFISHWK
jgi:hypothetical protein